MKRGKKEGDDVAKYPEYAGERTRTRSMGNKVDWTWSERRM